MSNLLKRAMVNTINKHKTNLIRFINYNQTTITRNRVAITHPTSINSPRDARPLFPKIVKSLSFQETRPC